METPGKSANLKTAMMTLIRRVPNRTEASLRCVLLLLVGTRSAAERKAHDSRLCSKGKSLSHGSLGFCREGTALEVEVDTVTYGLTHMYHILYSLGQQRAIGDVERLMSRILF